MSTRQQAFIAVIIILAISYLSPVLFDLIVGEQTFIPLPSADTLPACLLPISLLKDGDFFLDEYAGWIQDNWGENPYFVRVINNHIVSAYPVVTAILSIPVYALPVWAGWSSQPEQAFYIARISAGLLATLAMTIFYQICADRLDAPRSVLLTLALGLGSGMWTTVSQGLWQHTASIPFLFCAMWVLMRSEHHPRCVPWVGFLLSMATIARYNNVTTAILLSVYVLFHCRTNRTAFLLLAAIPWIGFFYTMHPFSALFLP